MGCRAQIFWFCSGWCNAAAICHAARAVSLE